MVANLGFWVSMSGFEAAGALIIPARGVALFTLASFLTGAVLRRRRALRVPVRTGG